jgi:hypothetical protein
MFNNGVDNIVASQSSITGNSSEFGRDSSGKLSFDCSKFHRSSYSPNRISGGLKMCCDKVANV